MRLSSTSIFILLYLMPGLRGAAYLYYPILFISGLGFLFNLKISTSRFDSTSQLFVILFSFFIISLLWPSGSFPIPELLIALIRLLLVLLMLTFMCSSDKNSNIALNYFIFTVFAASFSILLQFLFGPFDFLLAEEASTRSGISRFSSFAGSTTILGSAIPFAIVLLEKSSFFSKAKFYGLNAKFLAQIFLLLISFLTLSRSAIVLSAASILIVYSGQLWRFIYGTFSTLHIKYSYRLHPRSIFIVLVFFFSFLISFTYVPLFSNLVVWVRVTFGFASKDLLVDRGMSTETGSIIVDSVKRLTWFKDNLTETPLSLILGHGTTQFGGVLGISESYAHNTFIDIFQAGGIVALLLFSMLIISCVFKVCKRKEPLYNLGMILIFIVLSIFNSGTLFHPLLIFPILYISSLE